MPLKNGRQSSDLQTILVGSVIPAGTIAPFAGGTVPEGWMLCDGTAINRTTYSALFSAVGTAHGQGNGSTTFNLPDYRGQFLRGRVNLTTITGSGTVPIAPNNNRATFTNHGINRTGFKIRLSSGTLGGLATSTDYYAIVVDSNTLAFATTLSNALAGTRITLTAGSTNSAVLVQYEDPDASSRTAAAVGGSSAGGLGSIQDSATKQHRHLIAADSGSATVLTLPTQSFNKNGSIQGAGDSEYEGSTSGAVEPTVGFSSLTGESSESRPKNSLVNYIIKY
jgi:microcystin-dependent protein